MLDVLDALRVDHYADYRWGRYEIVLHPASGYQSPKQFIAGLAGQFQSTANWRDEEGFRAFASVAHELVHYLQDLATGVGHWDYVQRKRATSQALVALRLRTCAATPRYTLGVTAAARQVRELAEGSLRNVYPRRRRHARAAFVAAASAYRQYERGAEKDYDLDVLLELDAVLSVYCGVSQLRMSPEQKEVRDANRKAWWPLAMAPPYRRPFARLLHTLALIMNGGAPIDDQAVEHALTLSCSLLPVFLDSAFAYPPPSYFDRRAGDRPHFEPGLRLVRMLRRVQQAGVIESVHAKTQSLDDAIRETDEYAYPSVSDVYADWAAWFAGKDSALEQLRRELAERHAANPQRALRRRASAFLESDLPVFLKAPDGDGHVIQTNRLIRDTGGQLHSAFITAERDAQLFALAVNRSPKGYVCPLDRHGCKGHTALCAAGHASLLELPQMNCLVRDELRQRGFLI